MSVFLNGECVYFVISWLVVSKPADISHSMHCYGVGHEFAHVIVMRGIMVSATSPHPPPHPSIIMAGLNLKICQNFAGTKLLLRLWDAGWGGGGGGINLYLGVKVFLLWISSGNANASGVVIWRYPQIY